MIMNCLGSSDSSDFFLFKTPVFAIRVQRYENPENFRVAGSNASFLYYFGFLMGKFSQRSSEIEIMDDLDCSGEVVHQTLHEIEFINRWLGGNSITLNSLKRLLRKHNPQRVRIADLGCGGGGMLREVNIMCRKLGIECELTGIDANPNIIDFARQDNQDMQEIKFEVADIFSEEFQKKEFDIMLCTLVAHHFSNNKLTSLFASLKTQTKFGIIINDLERSPWAYYSIKYLTQLFSKSEMVKFDAPLSVLRGFRKKELQQILRDTQITSYHLRWRWAFRWELVF